MQLLSGTHYVAKAGLKLLIPLAPSLKCWAYRHTPHPPQLTLKVLGTQSASIRPNSCYEDLS